ncbi:MAG: hypothetical protein AVDCRST_MAG41-4138, partial [uncultured Corynebacteriales bacterium]
GRGSRGLRPARVAAGGRHPAGAACRDRAVPRSAHHADHARGGAAAEPARHGHRCPVRTGTRNVHRLHHAPPGQDAPGRGAAGDVRHQREVDDHRQPVLAAGRCRGPDRPAHRPRARDHRGPPGRGRPGQLRLRLHRRRQGELGRVLRPCGRAGPARGARRPGQHAVLRESRRPRRPGRGDARHPGRELARPGGRAGRHLDALHRRRGDHRAQARPPGRPSSPYLPRTGKECAVSNTDYAGTL